MKKTSLMMLLVIGLKVSLVGQETAEANSERGRAERIWEEMIKVKGGREKLHSISNMLSFGGNSSKSKGIRLEVFPYKNWSWSISHTLGPPGPELEITVSLSEANRYRCYAEKFIERKDAKESLKCRKAKKDDEDGRFYFLKEQCIYLLETRWMQPRPMRVSRQKFGRETLDVVETLVSYSETGHQQRLDFLVDPETLLVRYVIDYYVNKYEGGKYRDRPLTLYVFDRYALADGIQMPSRETRPHDYKCLKKKRKRFYYTPLKFRFNVKYNKRLFKQPPSVAAGPDAWKPEKE